MDNNINDKLKELRIEDFIWIIYIGIIFMSWYSNSLERKYFTKRDLNAKTKYREIMVGIFIILFFVYLYFLYSSYESLKSLKPSDSEEKKQLVILSFIASLFILISGIIYLYVAYKDKDLAVELAFN